VVDAQPLVPVERVDRDRRQFLVELLSDLVVATTAELSEALAMVVEQIGRHTEVVIGARIAIDDFGTGYSSLSYLRRLPVDVLKIDQSFVASLEDASEQSVAVIRMIAELAEVLGLETIAEGIETDAQLAALVRIGCRVGQGYLLARPASPAEVTRLLAGRVDAA
jgi:EAL domain-containing protein (putative c-di-GMP-specific phosphodiesterase class I)